MATSRTFPLFNGFPREIGRHRKVVRNRQRFLDFVNIHNGKQSLYSTVYSFERLKTPWRCDYETAIVDKLFFDLDDEEAYEDVMKLHDVFTRDKLYHRIEFTGGGYQAFGFAQLLALKNKKDALYNASDYYERRAGIEPDTTVKGDIARICRIPGTYNVKRRKWAIPLTHDLLHAGDSVIRKAASKQVNVKKLDDWLLGGPELIDLSSFDTARKIDMTTPDGLEYDTDVPENVRIMIKCPALQLLTRDPNMNYAKRYHLILYLKENGYLPAEVLTFLKAVLSPKKFRHCTVEEKAPQYIFRRDDLLMANRETLQKNGICIFDCKNCDLEGIYA